MAKQSPVLVLGEALVDVVHQGGQVTEHVGGSPANVAFGLREGRAGFAALGQVASILQACQIDVEVADLIGAASAA